jgi:superfamily II DNA or RNA helicase
MAVAQIARNAVIAKLINPERPVISLVNTLLSYTVDQGVGWSGKSSFFDVTNNTFPAGFVHVVHEELKKAGHDVQFIQKPLPCPLGVETPIVDEFGNDDPRYDYQLHALRQVEKHGAGIVRVATGGGKCLGKDTPVMMFDGTIKRVQDVVTGDLLMGPDSTPRRVLSTTKGHSKLYRVTPTKGDAYVVNDAHILSLKKTSRGYRGRNRDGEKYPKGEIVNINVERYLAETKTFRHIHKGWRTGVDFEVVSPPPVDPYFVGLLLGDGSINGTVSLTTADPKIVDEIERQAAIWGLNVMPYGKTQAENAAKTYHLTAGATGGKTNPLMAALRSTGLGLGEKFIPHAYKTASRDDRLALLAGVLDTDGYYDGKGLYLTLKSERLMDDVLFVARSLGFACYKKRVRKTCTNNGKTGDYFATSLSGPLETIPVRLERRKAAPRVQVKDPLVHGLSVEPLGMGDYYGFEIDGDHLFLLGDFTVTHNTKIAKLILKRYDRMTLFLTTRGILMYQMKAQLDAMGVETGVVGDGQMSFVKGVNLGMVQTLVSALEETSVDKERRALIKSLHGSRSKEAKASTMTHQELTQEAEAVYARKEKRRNAILRFLSMVEVVIGEEAHEAGGNSYYEILKHCRNANIRIALTATPFMRSSAEDNMRLMAAFGPVLIDIPEKLLIDRGILAKPYFKFRNVEPHPKLHRTSPYERAYMLGYIENPNMMRALVTDALRARQMKLPVLTLVLRKAHGEAIREHFAANGLNFVFLKGENDQTERRKYLDQLVRGEIDGIIGTTILDVGVDVPAIGLVQLAGGGKAEVALRQRIGRGLRSKKNTANVAFIVDYSCNANHTLREHAKQREMIVRMTPGFAEGILSDDEELPWWKFEGRAQAA